MASGTAAVTDRPEDRQTGDAFSSILWALSEAAERALRMSELALVANASLSKLSRAVTRLEREVFTFGSEGGRCACTRVWPTG